MDRRPPFDAADSRDVALYDELPLWSALAGQLLLEHVTLASRRSILDLGCGTGFPLLELAERLGRGAHVVGLDPWAGACAWDPRRLRVLHGSAQRASHRSA